MRSTTRLSASCSSIVELDQLIEGKRTILIKDGEIQHKALAAELLTKSELENIVHRQGVASLDEVHTCVLETGGTFSVEGKKPRQSAIEHQELLAKLDEMGRQIHELKQLVDPRGRLGMKPRNIASLTLSRSDCHSQTKRFTLWLRTEESFHP